MSEEQQQNNTSNQDEDLIVLNELADKWQKKWKETSAFNPNVEEGKKKFFLTFPYPYINAYSHIGHLYTLSRVDVLARYKRLKGFNVLFPQGWHVTGSPIVAAAKRVKENEVKQVKIMNDMGIVGDELKKFENPEYWIEFFAPEFKKDYSDFGMSIDWRREFFTTSLNPHYDKFIEWQFNTLKEKGYVIKGKFPVVWDPVESLPVGDHDRVKGEGETPQEYVLLKFKFGDEFIVAATLRPETVFGQTNLWVAPDVEYVKAKVNDETWIVSAPALVKLSEQDYKVEEIEKIMGKDLLGKTAVAPMINREIPILPASFPNPDKGTGIVTSVPSDAPDDHMGLVDLKNSKELERHGLSKDIVENIEYISIINSSDLGDQAAVKVCLDMKINNSKERDKLEKAKKLVYKKGFYEGTMLEACGEFKGMKVETAKNQIKKSLIEKGEAELLYELTGEVIARSLSKCVVKIVSDQWFMDYDNPEWKEKAHKCFDNMKLYPEKVRPQFNYVVDWLHQWACSREMGLGTRLPWDKKWLIESLSDSTIYMSYYTIAHRIKEIDAEKLDDNFFDYVFLNKGNADELKVEKDFADDLKKEFNYWYPVDFRNSGKDLIQNHLTFFVFSHTAMFEEDKWPQGIAANGWVTVDGEKMSKSLGNMIPMRDVIKDYSADVARVTILSGGEELDDPNWDSSFAKSFKHKLKQVLDFSVDNYNKGSYEGEAREIDNWMISRLNEVIKKAEVALEETLFRTAVQAIYFELNRNIKWYIKRTNNDVNREVMNKIVEAQILMLAPYTPHTCEEAWERIGKEGLVSLASWPEYDESKIEEDTEWLVREMVSDINTVKKLAKVEKISKVTLFTAKDWKFELFDELAVLFLETKNPKDIIGKLLSSELKKYSKDFMKVVPKMIKAGSMPDYFAKEKELVVINEAKEYLEKEFGCEVVVVKGEETDNPKSNFANPGKPALIVE